MVIIPSICNSLCFWLTDNFLRSSPNNNKSNDQESKLKKSITFIKIFNLINKIL